MMRMEREKKSEVARDRGAERERRGRDACRENSSRVRPWPRRACNEKDQDHQEASGAAEEGAGPPAP